MKNIVDEFIASEITTVPKPFYDKSARRHKNSSKDRKKKSMSYIKKQFNEDTINKEMIDNLLSTGNYISNGVEFVLKSRNPLYFSMDVNYNNITASSVCQYDGSACLYGDSQSNSQYIGRNKKEMKRRSSKIMRKYRPRDEDGVEVNPSYFSKRAVVSKGLHN